MPVLPNLTGQPQPVTDQGLTIQASGNVSGTGSALQPWVTTANLSGPGYLTLKLAQAAGHPCYIGLTGVTTTGFAIEPGEARTARYADVSAVFANPGSGDTLYWMVEA